MTQSVLKFKVFALKSLEKTSNFVLKKSGKPQSDFVRTLIQGHQFWYQLVACIATFYLALILTCMLSRIISKLLQIIDQIFIVDMGTSLQHICSEWTPKSRTTKFDVVKPDTCSCHAMQNVFW